MTAPDPVAVLVATQNLNAVLRIMQWGVIVLIFLFFLRVIRAVWVEMSPATIRKSRTERRQERRQERAAARPPTAPARAVAGSSTSRWSNQRRRPGVPTTSTTSSPSGVRRVWRRHVRGHLHLDAPRPPLPSQRPAVGRGPRFDQRDVRELRADQQAVRLGKGDLLQIGSTVFEVSR